MASDGPATDAGPPASDTFLCASASHAEPGRGPAEAAAAVLSEANPAGLDPSAATGTEFELAAVAIPLMPYGALGGCCISLQNPDPAEPASAPACVPEACDAMWKEGGGACARDDAAPGTEVGVVACPKERAEETDGSGDWVAKG